MIYQSTSHIIRSKFIIVVILINWTFITFSYAQNPCLHKLILKSDTVFELTNNELFNGEYFEYYPGNPKVSGNYKNGLKEGEFKYYSDNIPPRIDSIVTYSGGKKNGRTIHYWKYPVMQKSYIYNHNELDGICYSWHWNRQLASIKVYRIGQLVSEKEFEQDTNIAHIVARLDSFYTETIVVNKFIKDTLILRTVRLMADYDNQTFYIDSLPGYSIKSFDLQIHDLIFSRKVNWIKSGVFNSKLVGKEIHITNILAVDSIGVEFYLDDVEYKLDIE